MESKNPSGRRRVALAWLGTVVLVTYMALTTDLAQVWRALLVADQLLFFAALVVFTVSTYMADAASSYFLLRRAGFQIGFWDFARIKGASYLPDIAHYALAQVLMAAILKQRSARGWAASGSPFILLSFMDLSALSLLVLAGFALGGDPFPDNGLATWTIVIVAAGGVSGGPALCLLARPELWGALGLPTRWARHDLLLASRSIASVDYLATVALRVGLMILHLVMGYLFVVAFRFDMPVSDFMVLRPILGLVGAIPISVAGLGSTQLVMRGFFEPFAPAGRDPVASIDALSTASIGGALLGRVAVGVTCAVWLSALRSRGAARADTHR